MLAARLVSLYTADQQDTTLDVLLGAKSLDDLISRLDTVNRVSDQDAQVLRQVISFRKLVRTQERAARCPACRAGPRRREPRGREGARSRASSRSAGSCSPRSRARSRGSARPSTRASSRSASRRRAHGSPHGAARRSAGIGDRRPRHPTARASSRASPLRRRRRGRDADLGKPYVWARPSPAGFDCSGLVDVRRTRRSASRCRTRRTRSATGRLRLARPAPARRPRLLRRPRPRRHLHRRRPVHPRAAHGRRRQDLEPERGWYAAATSARAASSSVRRTARRSRRRSAPATTAAELQRRRHLALVGREVARQDPRSA